VDAAEASLAIDDLVTRGVAGAEIEDFEFPLVRSQAGA
jgi:hypothetical protein